MGLPKRGLDALGRLGAGEDEPGVARAFRERDKVLARMGGDGDLVDPRDGPGLRLAADLLQHPARGIGIIITPTARRSRSSEGIAMPSA